MTIPNNFSARPSKTSLLGWTILVSVILNLFLVGVLAGGMHGRHHGFGPMALAAPHGEYTVDWMLRHLTPQDAAAFRDSFQPQIDNLKQAHDRVHKATQEVATAYEQDPTDPAALQTALDHLSQAKAEAAGIVNAIVLASYPKLSPDGRHRLADLARDPR